MRIIKCKAKNFLSYKEFEYDYTAQGLTLIEGYDEDLDVNTGAGKSAFLDAICYGLFGATSKKLKADEVINWNVKKNLELLLTVEDNGETFTVHRYRKHKDHENDFFIEKNGEKIRGKDARETQKLLEGMIGFDMEIFTKAVYFGQFDEVDKFLRATDKQKKELIGTICDLSAYDDMFDSIKEKLKGHQEELDDLIAKKSPVQTKYDMLDSQIKGIDDQINEWEEKHKEKIEQLERLKNQEDEDKRKKLGHYAEANDQFELDKAERIRELEQESLKWMDERKAKIAQLEKSKEAWAQDIKDQMAEVDEDVQKFETSLQSVREKYASVKTKLAEKSEVESTVNALKEEIETFETYLPQIEQQKRSLAIVESKMSDLRTKIQQEGEKLNSGGGECPFCHQEVSAEHLKKHIDSLTQQGLGLKQTKESTELALKGLEEEYAEKAELEVKLKEAQEKLAEFSKLEWELSNLESEGKSLKNSIESRQREKQSLAQQVSPYEGQLMAVKASESPYEHKMASVMAEVNPWPEKMDELKGQKNGYIYQLEQAQKENNPYESNVKSMKSERSAAKKELKDLKEKIEKVEHEMKLGLFWKEALGTYIRSFLMDSFLEQLNNQANDYLETLFNGVLKIELSAVTEGKKNVKEKISQKIYNGNIECSYDSLSGGERCRVCLAINLALSDITSKTLGKTVSILMLDEIFTGLDNAGKSQTMKLLKELEPRFETIFVIDHTEEFKSLFTNNIMIRKKGGVSLIS